MLVQIKLNTIANIQKNVKKQKLKALNFVKKKKAVCCK